MLRQENIDPATLSPGPDDVFTPQAAREGALYPIEGGMNPEKIPAARTSGSP